MEVTGDGEAEGRGGRAERNTASAVLPGEKDPIFPDEKRVLHCQLLTVIRLQLAGAPQIFGGKGDLLAAYGMRGDDNECPRVPTMEARVWLGGFLVRKELLPSPPLEPKTWPALPSLQARRRLPGFASHWPARRPHCPSVHCRVPPPSSGEAGRGLTIGLCSMSGQSPSGRAAS